MSTAATGDLSAPDLAPVEHSRRSVNWRSLLLGTAAVIAVCGLTPYNDFVFSNTSMAAGFVPLVAVLIQFLLIVGINAPLHRWAPRHALHSGELAVIFMMTLVACGLPNWGLIRFLIPMPVAPFRLGGADMSSGTGRTIMAGDFWRIFQDLGLPQWLFPVDLTDENARTSPIVRWFYNSTPQDESIPWRAWIVPLLAWSVFAGALVATLAAMARLVLDQWMTNERLPFPLVQVQTALIESPSPGNALNSFFRSKWLWIGLGIVFFIHTLTALNAYFPKNVPKISLGFDFIGLLTDTPLQYLRPRVRRASLAFMIIGVTYFIRSKVAFSLWGAYLLMNLVVVQARVRGSDFPDQPWSQQHLGASLAFVLGILWVGRHHWIGVLRNAVGAGDGSKHRIAFWIAVAGTVTMIGWLLIVGVKLIVAVVIVVFALIAHLVVSRVLAETGLPFYRSAIAATQVFSQFPMSAFSGRDIYFTGVGTALGPLTTRDSIMTFTMHGLGLCKTPEADGAEQRDRARLGGAIAWTLLLGFIVAASVTLYCHYSYPTPYTDNVTPARNYFGAVRIPERELKEPLENFRQGQFEPPRFNPLLHMAIGFIVTAVLEFGALRWTWWPLLPVGYVTSYGSFIENAWFSVFVGWLIKVLLVRFGGGSLYIRAKPFFIGIIFGEALAAGFWLLVNALLVVNGHDGKPVQFIPG